MLDPGSNLVPSSPTNSSISSSDLDTESTGSFFHDRSTTLGTLMGVTFRAPSRRRQHASPSAAARRAAAEALAAVAEQRRRRWRRWWPCGDEHDDDVATRTRSSLGEFLEVERRFDDVAGFGEAVRALTPHGEGVLFAEGRVLPPPAQREEPSDTGRLYRFPVNFIGICSCGAG